MSSAIRHLYVHIPFCPKKCDYCAFTTHVGSLRLMEPYIEALKREAQTVCQDPPAASLETVYFGGGTPSLMSPEQVAGLLTHFSAIFGMESGTEVTLEAHPATVDAPELEGFRQAGVTRVSFGAESMDTRELALLGREHQTSNVMDCLNSARAARFTSINLDLMYGIPGQSLASWQRTLTAVRDMHPDHLALYPLAIESGTVFARKWGRDQLVVPDGDLVAGMYRMACEELSREGYEHYEVANWCRPGHSCRHNLAYWWNREFYALGVGAHGYLKPYRTQNVRQTRRYIERVLGGVSPVTESEFIDPRTEFNETVMLRLRLLQEGLNTSETESHFGIDIRERFGTDIRHLVAAGLLSDTAGTLRLEEDAVLVGNEIWQRFVL